MTTIELAEEAAVIQITPWVQGEDGNLRAPVLVVQTCAGELEFFYCPTRNRFSVVGRKLRFSGMPAGVTMYVHRDEASYNGEDLARMAELPRVPRWSVSGADRRSDGGGREPTRTMVHKCQIHLEFVTNDCGKAHMFRALVEITGQWEARRRACALKAEIDALTAEYHALSAAISADNFPAI